jgi:CDP-glucose 4,6-dehydratase
MDKITSKQLLSTFKGKKVFVTGHTGFKGTWLTFLLNELGAEVMGFALAPDPKISHFNLLKLDSKIHHVVGDVRDKTALVAALTTFKPDFVFHLAAQALVKQSYADPADTFDTNVMGSVNILEAVKQCDSVRSFVYITSDKCYENVEWIWGYRENDRLGGHDPYSASKAAAEIVFSAYYRSYFFAKANLGAATTRAGNVIGGGDWAADRIIPDCIRAIESDKSIVLRNPKATRPWQHVLEPISGYLLLGARLFHEPKKYAGAWNFGPPSSEVRTVHDVAKVIVQQLGKGKIEVSTANNHVHEAQLLQLNCDKAHQLLGWYPRWNVDETLAATAQWYKAFLSGANVEDMTRSQLYNYFNELT